MGFRCLLSVVWRPCLCVIGYLCIEFPRVLSLYILSYFAIWFQIFFLIKTVAYSLFFYKSIVWVGGIWTWTSSLETPQYGTWATGLSLSTRSFDLANSLPWVNIRLYEFHIFLLSLYTLAFKIQRVPVVCYLCWILLKNVLNSTFHFEALILKFRFNS